MADDQTDLQFQQVLNDGISEMNTVTLESSLNDHQNQSNYNSSQSRSSSIFSLQYYKQFFNVNTEDVIKRIIMAINPLNNTFISLADPPDLYGPVWISFTSPFLMLIFGNLTAWSEKGKEWRFNFYPFVVAALLTFAFVFGGPFLFRWFTTFFNPPSLFQLICLFGYSTIFMIPVGFVCLLVGLKADYVISIIGGITMGASIFMKLNKAFDAPARAFLPNLIASGVAGLLCFVVQALLFR